MNEWEGGYLIVFMEDNGIKIVKEEKKKKTRNLEKKEAKKRRGRRRVSIVRIRRDMCVFESGY